MRSRWYLLRSVMALVLVAALLISLAMVSTAASLRADDQILGSVWIEGVNVGGLRVAEARDALKGRAEDAVGRTVTLRHEGEAFEVTLEELGGRADIDGALTKALEIGRNDDIPSSLATRVETLRHGRETDLPLTFSADILKDRLTKIAWQLNREPKAAQLSLDGIELEVAPHTVGWTLDIAATGGLIEDSFATAFVGAELAMVVIKKAPDVTSELLAKYEVLGHFATRFNPGQANRSENLRLGAESCNDVIIPSGGVFSLNATTGPRSPAKGYKLAGVYSGTRTVLGYGGGVCQISTTAYNAALVGEMKILERHSHSKPVPYAPWGRDATVSWGLADMKFQNSMKHPVIMKMWIDGNMLNASILGIPEKLPEQDLIQAADEMVHQAQAAQAAMEATPEPDGLGALLTRGTGAHAF